MDGAVAPELAAERLRECDEVQSPITEAARDALVRAGAEIEVLVDGVDAATGDAFGRTHREAPEIDGVVRLAVRRGRTELATSTGDGVVRLEVARVRAREGHRHRRSRPRRRADRGASLTERPEPRTAREVAADATAQMRRFGETAIKTPANVVTIAAPPVRDPGAGVDPRRAHGDRGARSPGWIVLWVTDGLDGWLARRDGTTRSGAFLDPLADKIARARRASSPSRSAATSRGRRS